MKKTKLNAPLLGKLKPITKNNKRKLSKQGNFILAGSLSAALLLALSLGIISSKALKNKNNESEDYFSPSTIDSIKDNIEEAIILNKSFDPRNQNELNKVLDDYKDIFEERGIEVNYKFLEYWILFDNHIFPEEVLEFERDEYVAFKNSFNELLDDVIYYNFDAIPDDFISLTGLYGKDTQIDAYFVDLSEKYQFDIINSYYYDSEEEFMELIEEYFWFQINIIIDGQSMKINNQEVEFESFSIPTKGKILKNITNLNAVLNKLGFLKGSVSRVEFNRETREDELVEYELLDIAKILRDKFLDNSMDIGSNLYNEARQYSK